MVLEKLFRGRSGRSDDSSDGEELYYCPVVTCYTLKQLSDPRKASAVKTWIERDVLGLLGPGKEADLKGIRRPEKHFSTVNNILAESMDILEIQNGFLFSWRCELPTNRKPHRSIPRSTSQTVDGIARWCWIMGTPGVLPTDQSPTCRFCGGQTSHCAAVMDRSYERAFGDFLAYRMETPKFDSFSEKQRAAFSIAVTLATLQVVATELGMTAAANQLRLILASWLPILLTAWKAHEG